MPPNRYGQQSMNTGPYSQFSQHNQVQAHGQTQQHMLPPPSLGAPANFGHATSASTSPFAIAGNTGLERPFGDVSLSQAQGPHGVYGRNAPAQALQYESAAHTPEDPRIRNVWKNNMMTEMANLRRLVTKYPYIAMDTEFPGIVARPVGAFTNKADYHYQTLRCNVDLLKMIQLGITLFKPDGTTPSDNEPPTVKNMTAVCTWQFNFQFDIEGDMYAHASTQMLRQAGLNFDLHKRDGIDPRTFAARLIDSGLVLDHQVKWISFHSGYDFGYLMKIMLNQELPETEAQFHEKLDKFFPSLFDIKYIVKYIGAKGSVNDNQELTPEANRIIQIITQKSGLQDLANELGIQRVGAQHQAGSDSLLTGQVYFKMREKIFGGTIDEDRYKGQIWGLNGQMPQTSSGPSGGAGVNMGTTPNMNGAQFYSSANGPSTPQTGHIGLAQTPAGASTLGGHSSYGSLTPGTFGNFSYAKG